MVMPSDKWDRRFMDVAKLVSTWSKDRSTQVGAVIVNDSREIVATGYNGFARGVDDAVEKRHSRPAKYLWTEHGDRNALYTAARRGISLLGTTMYIYSSRTGVEFPCCDCARGIIQAGVSNLVTLEPNFEDPKWGDDCRTARDMFAEGGVWCRSLPR